MDLGIEGRRALVAASSAGLGFSTAAALHDAGCRVALNGRDEARLAEAVDRLPGTVGIAGDVSNVRGAETLVSSATAALGGVDILVCNAGGPTPGGFDDIPTDGYAAALELSLLSTVALCRAAIDPMRDAGWGRVLAITSTSVREPIDGLILSNTARAGVTGFLRTMANAVAGRGVTVNSIQPGLHATARMAEIYGDGGPDASGVPLGVVGDPDDFGKVAAFLCSEPARYITGAAVPVDGGRARGLQ